MKLYVLTVANEDSFVSVLGGYKTPEKAIKAMDTYWRDNITALDSEGFVPVMKKDERARIITWGNGHLLRFQLSPIEIKH